MSIKQEALDHYDRMIKQAEKYDKYSFPSCAKMYADIKENWNGDSCSYCISCGGKCGRCKISKPFRIGDRCCDGLWGEMNSSPTWQEWIINAKKVKAYIKKHG